MKAKTFLYFSATIALVIASACNGNNAATTHTDSVDATSNVDGDTTQLPPVENRRTKFGLPTAFKGQTRIAGAKTTTPYKVDKIAQGLGNHGRLFQCPLEDYSLL
jgi:hypothetical protein